MKHKFQEPRPSLRSLFLIHREDKSSNLAGAMSMVISYDKVTMCEWADLIGHRRFHSGTGHIAYRLNYTPLQLVKC